MNTQNSWHVGLLTLVWCFHACRSQDLKQRKRYVKLVDTVRETGGDVKIFSSLHVSGERKYRNLFGDLFLRKYWIKVP